MKTLKILTNLALIAGLAASTSPAFAGRIALHTGTGTGGVVGSNNGNTWARGHTVQSVNGSTVAASGGAFKTASGAYGGRASTTTYNPATGQGTHQGGYYATGAKGTVSSQGSSSYNNGVYSGNRTTSATSTKTGDSYNGSTTYSNGSAQHTGTCTDASGVVITCP